MFWFSMVLTLDEQKEDDWVFETNGVKLLIDPMSGVYFHGDNNRLCR